MLLSHLSLKSYNLNRAIVAYEKYLNVFRKNFSNTEESPVKTGEKILEGLKTVADEIKKKQGLLKNKEDSRKVFDELCKKYVNRIYWEDLERPFNKIIIEPESTFNHILKKGFTKSH